MEKVEPKILAPVNGIEMTKVVLDAGADILYAGVKGWSLRPDMFEVTEETFKEIISLVLEKKRWIFPAFNCFYRSSEIPGVMERIRRYVEWGISGVILSEPGLIQLVKKEFPDLQIHISVQSSASSSLDVDYYREIGANAVVLPRDMIDLKLENVKAMAGRGVKIEIFAVGDDSTNYDGRCMFSAYLHQKVVPDPFGRESLVLGNANRCGYCFLVCKRRCKIDGREGHLLRRGDLGLHRRIPELLEAGVEVFKVQGREFPLHLVGKLISTFRKLLDSRDDPEKLKEYTGVMNDLVLLKQVIAANHLWLLSKSKSPAWKQIRKYIEKPWDDLTSSLWFKSKGFKDLMKNVRGLKGVADEQ